MGLCSGKASVALCSRAEVASMEEGSGEAGCRSDGTATWSGNSAVTEATKTREEPAVRTGTNPSYKGYLELGEPRPGSGAVQEDEETDTDKQPGRGAVQEDEETDTDEMEEQLRFSESEGSEFIN